MAWRQPSGWTGPSVNLYESFDCMDSLTLMEGTEVVEKNALIAGKVGLCYF